MIRILHVFGRLDMGGAESRIMDLYRNIDRKKIQFDFVEHTEDKCFYDDEIKSLGGTIYRIPRFKFINMKSYEHAWEELFKAIQSKEETKVVMVQGHMTSTASVYLPIAKKHGVSCTIAHARSAGVDPGIKGYLTRIMRMSIPKKADRMFTCSQAAGISAFGKKAVLANRVRFVPNAIDCEKFKYDEEVRNRIRTELGIEDSLVIGHVGRFHYAKNHEFLIKVFRDFLEDWEVQKKENDFGFSKKPVLIMVGDGGKMANIKSLVLEYGISKNVIFLGKRTNVSDYYQAMDFFLYPSRYEGLPGTVVEAQSSGLPVLMSDAICDEVVVTDLVKTMSLSKQSDLWSEEIIRILNKMFSSDNNRVLYNEEVIKSGFDVKSQAEIMEKFYLSGSFEDEL